MQSKCRIAEFGFDPSFEPRDSGLVRTLKPGRQFDLEERTASFGEAVIRFAKTMRETAVTRPPVKQLVRAATSVGANYCEANDAESKTDFRHKIAICRRESRETGHWLRMLAAALPESAQQTRKLWQEAKELNLIFDAVIRSIGVARLLAKTPDGDATYSDFNRARVSLYGLTLLPFGLRVSIVIDLHGPCPTVRASSFELDRQLLLLV